MSFLYFSTDLGINSSGGLVSIKELEAMEELAKETNNNVITFNFKDIHPTQYKLPDLPMLIDHIAMGKLLKMDLSSVKLAHFYGGCYSNTIQYLKSKNIKTTFTLMWHDRITSITEHEKFMGSYPYIYVKDDTLFKMFTDGIRYADIVIAAGSIPRDNMLKEGAKRVEIIPLGCDIPNPDRIKPFPKEFRVGYLGAVGVDKGLFYLIKAWEQLNYTDSTLILAGPHSEQLPKFINAIVKTGNFHIQGYVNDVADFYSSISIYVQPSATEAFGMETIQAMSYGKPLIVSDGVGSSDTIINNENGFIVPKMNIEAIAEKIKFFKDNPNEIIRMGNNARIKSLNYTWKNTQTKYITSWRELLLKETGIYI
jgi:glycosyltransferase involved in cell wall biosynthesis